MIGGWRKASDSMIRACADSGFTLQETADHCRVTYQNVLKRKKELGLTFRRGQRTLAFHPRQKERADTMAERYRAGETLNEIGQSYGITRERVRQLINKYHGITKRDGGIHVQAEQRRSEREAKREARYLVKHGCTYRQWREISPWARLAFSANRNYTRTIKVDWSLTLWDWWTVWQQSGLWDQRGRGGYKLARIDKSGPFSRENIHVVSSSADAFFARMKRAA